MTCEKKKWTMLPVATFGTCCCVDMHCKVLDIEDIISGIINYISIKAFAC